jgi:regulator of RNase E activity RraA
MTAPKAVLLAGQRSYMIYYSKRYGMSTLLLADRLATCYSGAVYDVLREFGVEKCVLPHAIKCVDVTHRIAGPAFTMSGARRDLDPHETLLRWTEFLSKVPAGAVVVCQPNDDQLAHMGELSAETLLSRGVKGYVVDGGTRDTTYVVQIGFPVFCRYQTPADIVGRWVPTTFQHPVRIGDVTVYPDDLIFGDIDGVVVVPCDMAQRVVERIEEVMNTENRVRAAIRAGADPQQAYLKYGLF